MSQPEAAGTCTEPVSSYAETRNKAYHRPVHQSIGNYVDKDDYWDQLESVPLQETSLIPGEWMVGNAAFGWLSAADTALDDDSSFDQYRGEKDSPRNIAPSYQETIRGRSSAFTQQLEYQDVPVYSNDGPLCSSESSTLATLQPQAAPGDIGLEICSLYPQDWAQHSYLTYQDQTLGDLTHDTGHKVMVPSAYECRTSIGRRPTTNQQTTENESHSFSVLHPSSPENSSLPEQKRSQGLALSEPAECPREFHSRQSDKYKTKSSHKKTHNDVERKYRASINDGLAELRKTVPSLQVPEVEGCHTSQSQLARSQSKWVVLGKAVQYIRELEQVNLNLVMEHRQLASRLQVLEALLLNTSCGHSSSQL